MALMESRLIPLDSPMPQFELKDPYGKTYHSDQLCGEKGLIVIFTCNHCPYALAVWPRVIRWAEYARPVGINTVAINPNIHPDYPEDAPDKMIEKITQLGIKFPYLVDDTQNTARAFKAQCTPDTYFFNHEKKLIYHGRIDDNWKDERKVNREDLRTVIDQITYRRPVSMIQTPSMGCSIKWRE